MKYEVWVTVWSEEHRKQIKVVAGEFDKFMNAKIFKDAYQQMNRSSLGSVSRRRLMHLMNIVKRTR